MALERSATNLYLLVTLTAKCIITVKLLSDMHWTLHILLAFPTGAVREETNVRGSCSRRFPEVFVSKEVPQTVFLLLWTRLTLTTSCCVLHMWKANSGNHTDPICWTFECENKFINQHNTHTHTFLSCTQHPMRVEEIKLMPALKVKLKNTYKRKRNMVVKS